MEYVQKEDVYFVFYEHPYEFLKGFWSFILNRVKVHFSDKINQFSSLRADSKRQFSDSQLLV